MNQATDKLLGNYKPELLIAVYKSEGEVTSDSYYLESHAVAANGAILAGKPLQAETISNIVESLHEKHEAGRKMGGVMPQRLLYADNRKKDYALVWYSPAQIRHLHFVDSLNLKSGPAWVPAMLYIAGSKSLSVYALANDVRPDEKTELYDAPFYNVSGGGIVCLGSAETKRKGDTYEDYLNYWETIFWNSIFTHGVSRTVSPMYAVWQALLADNTKMFDGAELVPAKKQLKDILNKL